MPSTRSAAARDVPADVPPPSAWQEISTELLERPDVVGTYIGKRIEGNLLREEWAVIVLVDKKKPKPPRGQDIPKEVRWPLGNGVMAMARTDVQERFRRVPYKRVPSRFLPRCGGGGRIPKPASSRRGRGEETPL